MIQPGDVWVRVQPDGRYGAVRILRTEGRSHLVYTSEYLGSTPPAQDDPRLRQPVPQHRFFFDGQPAMLWLPGKPPVGFQFLCNLPLTRAESEVVCHHHGGGWGGDDGTEAYLEWRWFHDRPALEDEVRRKAEEREALRKAKALAQSPKRMMALATFWSLIRSLDWQRTGDDDAVIAPVVEALSAKSRNGICLFEERLAFLLYQLDTRAHACGMGTEVGHPEEPAVSSDAFLYARCAVVANGRVFYDSVLQHPERMPADLEFEALLRIGRMACEAKLGEPLEYETGCSFESFSNRAGWP